MSAFLKPYHNSIADWQNTAENPSFVLLYCLVAFTRFDRNEAARAVENSINTLEQSSPAEHWLARKEKSCGPDYPPGSALLPC